MKKRNLVAYTANLQMDDVQLYDLRRWISNVKLDEFPRASVSMAIRTAVSLLMRLPEDERLRTMKEFEGIE